LLLFLKKKKQKDFYYRGVEEFMAGLMHTLHTLVSFALVLGILVFIHELGHYIAARAQKIHVEAFSIGFGPTLLSWTDRHETVWKLCLLPLGGFVKMHGMAVNIADENAIDMTSNRPGEAYFEKTVLARAIVAAAGPVANFLLAAVLFSGLNAVVGQQVPLPVVGDIAPGSAAAVAGLHNGDAIRFVDGQRTMEFEDLRRIVAASAGKTLSFAVHRGNQDLTLPVTIQPATPGDMSVGRLGVKSGEVATVHMGLFSAITTGFVQTWQVLWQTLVGLVHIVTTGHGVNELGGPIAIASLSGKVAELGIASLVGFIAMLSINLGLVNLLPIPVLDGGHLMFYAAEAVRGRPLPARALDYGYRVGFAIIASLFVFISWNDLVHTGAVHWVAHIFG
jgi:regulator of sigma E protease